MEWWVKEELSRQGGGKKEEGRGEQGSQRRRGLVEEQVRGEGRRALAEGESSRGEDGAAYGVSIWSQNTKFVLIIFPTTQLCPVYHRCSIKGTVVVVQSEV